MFIMLLNLEAWRYGSGVVGSFQNLTGTSCRIFERCGKLHGRYRGFETKSDGKTTGSIPLTEQRPWYIPRLAHQLPPLWINYHSVSSASYTFHNMHIKLLNKQYSGERLRCPVRYPDSLSINSTYVNNPATRFYVPAEETSYTFWLNISWLIIHRLSSMARFFS